jgi:uncharacterized protein YjbJ (UPF0337 family)
MDFPLFAMRTAGSMRDLTKGTFIRAGRCFRNKKCRERWSGIDKDRVQGAFEQRKGWVKEGVGKMTADTALETEGKAQKTAGKVQNAAGGAKDAARDALRDK